MVRVERLMDNKISGHIYKLHRKRVIRMAQMEQQMVNKRRMRIIFSNNGKCCLFMPYKLSECRLLNITLSIKFDE